MKMFNSVRDLFFHVIPGSSTVLSSLPKGLIRNLYKYLYRPRIKSGMTIVLIVLLPLLFFWPVWLKGKLPIPADALAGLYHPFRDYYASNFPNGIPFKNYILTDPVLQQYPWKKLAIDQIGNILKGFSLKDPPLSELGNPYSFGGYASDSIENIQAGAFYPLNLIFILINNFSSAWSVFIVIQPILASIFMYWWLKNNGIRGIPAVFGGLVWAFSSFNLVWLEWGNIGHAGLWLPLALLCVDKIAKNKQDIVIPGLTRNLFWHIILQFSLASSLFAGHFQITLYLLTAVGLYWFIRLGISKTPVLLFTVHCLLFTFFSSPQWFPSLRFSLQSNRSVEQANALSREGFFIRPRQLAQLMAPDFFGNPSTLNYRGAWNYAEQVIYIGVIPLIFSIVAIFYFVIPGLTRNLFKYLYRSRTESVMTEGTTEIFSLILIFFGLLFAVDNSVSRLPYQLRLPVISDLQPTRLSYLIVFGLSTLSAFGLNEFIKHPKKLLSKVLAISALLAVLLFALLIISSKFSPDAKLISQRNLIFPFITLGAAALISVGFRIFPNKIYPLLITFYFLLSTSDLFRFGWKFTPFSPGEYLYPVTPSIKFLQDNMEINDRYMTLDRRLLPPNANIMYKLKSIEGYDPIYSKAYAAKIAGMENGDEIIPEFGRIIRPVNFRSPVARELGVKYVLSLEDLKDPILEKVFQEGETRIYELTGK